jgi:hypothetical protein
MFGHLDTTQMTLCSKFQHLDIQESDSFNFPSYCFNTVRICLSPIPPPRPFHHPTHSTPHNRPTANGLLNNRSYRDIYLVGEGGGAARSGARRGIAAWLEQCLHFCSSLGTRSAQGPAQGWHKVKTAQEEQEGRFTKKWQRGLQWLASNAYPPWNETNGGLPQRGGAGLPAEGPRGMHLCCKTHMFEHLGIKTNWLPEVTIVAFAL